MINELIKNDLITYIMLITFLSATEAPEIKN
jgi:hypothetical protein